MMSKQFFKIILLLIPVFFQSCFDSDLVFEDQFEPVVEAYLFKGKPFEDVTISSMISFGSDTTIGGVKITNAEVKLIYGHDNWTLKHNDEDPGHYFLEDSLEFIAKDTIELNIVIDNRILNAKTVMPANPPLVTMSSTTLKIPKVTDMREFQEIEMPDPVEFTWENEDARYFFLRIQNIEGYEDPIRPDPPDDMPFRQGGFNFQMDLRPTNDNYYSLSAMELTNFGTHRIIFYSVNEEYVSLYNSQDQDSQELNEPYSNIENGLGIFTAFSSDTMYLEVVPVY